MLEKYTADSWGGTYWGNTANKINYYEWTKNTDGTDVQTCHRFIGAMDNGAGSNGSDTKTVAGTISANTLVMTYNNNEYSFTIPTITIHNPY